MAGNESLMETPKRHVLGEVTNVSPTANLKLLINVALQCPYQRKEKSLQILCDRFLEIYPLEGNCVNVEIQLDATAQKLGVEKRRIYDIINILEALHCATRHKKNTYIWHGSSKLYQFLDNLKSQGESMNARKREMIVPKRRSLGNLAQRFLMMFFVEKPNTFINLDMAVSVLIQNPQTVNIECNKSDRQHKSRVRRLYDIANVLSSIGLIRKVSNTVLKKPVFCYVGPRYSSVKMTPLSSTMLTPDSINVTQNPVIYPTSNRSKRKLEFSSFPNSPSKYRNVTPPLTPITPTTPTAPNSDINWHNIVQVAANEYTKLNEHSQAND